MGVLGAGSRIQLFTQHQSARLLLLAGIPLHEPIVKHGPFVMNTADQIQQAINDYMSGNFS
jgi:quercetin 2,3-dioxygenase